MQSFLSSCSTVMAIAPPAEMQGRAMICVLQKLVLVKSVRLSQTNSPLKLLIEDDIRKNIPLHRLRTKIGTRFLAILLNRFLDRKPSLMAAADHLFTSPPRPRPLSFDPLPLTTPGRTVPPTPSTALHHKSPFFCREVFGPQIWSEIGCFSSQHLWCPLNLCVKIS